LEFIGIGRATGFWLTSKVHSANVFQVSGVPPFVGLSPSLRRGVILLGSRTGCARSLGAPGPLGSRPGAGSPKSRPIESIANEFSGDWIRVL
jgi:hypothetical protein